MGAGRWNEAGQALEQLETRSVLALDADGAVDRSRRH